MRYQISYFRSANDTSCHALIKFKELEDINDIFGRMKLVDAEVIKIKNYQPQPAIKVNYDLPHDPRFSFTSYSTNWMPFTVGSSDARTIYEFDSDEEALLFFEVYDG